MSNSTTNDEEKRRLTEKLDWVWIAFRFYFFLLPIGIIIGGIHYFNDGYSIEHAIGITFVGPLIVPAAMVLLYYVIMPLIITIICFIDSILSGK